MDNLAASAAADDLSFSLCGGVVARMMGDDIVTVDQLDDAKRLHRVVLTRDNLCAMLAVLS